MADTEAEAIAAMAAEPQIHDITPGELETIAYPPGWTIVTADHERFLPKPRRSAGRIVVRDAAGFTNAIHQRANTVPAVLYADEATQSLVAVLNDDLAAEPGWRDYTVVLELRRRPEWMHWLSLDGKLVAQAEFATHIEDGLKEIVLPSAADMLDLAQTFEATTNAKFKGGQRLATGERQFVYEEDIDAKAGTAGQVAIPDTFTLRIAPFYGGAPVDIDARFRFQLRGGDLKLGYRLDRPDDVALSAFNTIVEQVENELDIIAINGPAPSAR